MFKLKKCNVTLTTLEGVYLEELYVTINSEIILCKKLYETFLTKKWLPDKKNTRVPLSFVYGFPYFFAVHDRKKNLT